LFVQYLRRRETDAVGVKLVTVQPGNEAFRQQSSGYGLTRTRLN